MTTAYEIPPPAPWDVTTPLAPVARETPAVPSEFFRPAPSTICPELGPDTDDEPRRVVRALHQRDVLALVGAVVAGLSTALLLFGFLAPFTGKIGFVAVAFAIFLGFYALLVATEESGPAVRDRTIMALIHGVAVLLLLGLVFVIGYTFNRAREGLTRLNQFTEDLSAAGPLEPLSVGGIKHAIIGTLWMITIALIITIPLGMLCALFLYEMRGSFPRFVRTIVEAMTALPSIVAGLFIYALFIIQFGQGKSGFAAALALSVMMLPIMIRASDVVLRLVPGTLKEASFALGAGQWRTAWHVTLPTARSGLATAVILATARGIGETSPVLLTAGYTALTNTNPLEGPMVSLPLATFELVKSPEANFQTRAFVAAATLLTLVLLLFIVARIIGGRGPGNLTKRQQRRAVAASHQDFERMAQRADAHALPDETSSGAAGRLLSNPTLTDVRRRLRVPTLPKLSLPGRQRRDG